ncbi:MAG: histidine phosphatase family protein [Bacteroidales bacterium]|nr:histidine phosphatase family protein [Bacteroidales bacterium]
MLRSSIIPVLVLFTAMVSFSQDISQKELKRFYKNQEKVDPISLYFDSTSRIMQIVLIRHAEPDLDKRKWRNRDEAIQFLNAYDSAGIVPFFISPVNINTFTSDTVLCSPLPRARITAQRIFKQQFILKEDSAFREFENKITRGCNIKLPTKCWTTGSRLFWLMGLNNKSIESFREARQRAENNARGLASLAIESRIVALVAHGLHNKYVKKYLYKAGWRDVFNSGNGYLSMKIMAMEGTD